MRSTTIHGFFKFAVNSLSVGKSTHTLGESALLSASALCAEGMWLSLISAREKWSLKGEYCYNFITSPLCWQHSYKASDREKDKPMQLHFLYLLIPIDCAPMDYVILHKPCHPPYLQERAVKDGFAEGILLGRPLMEKWKTTRYASSLSQSVLLLL